MQLMVKPLRIVTLGKVTKKALDVLSDTETADLLKNYPGQRQFCVAVNDDVSLDHLKPAAPLPTPAPVVDSSTTPEESK